MNDTEMPEQGNYHELDARGLLCPEPVMMLHNRVREVESGEVLRVLATDPSTERDIGRFCDFLGHTLLEFSQSELPGQPPELVFWIRKK